jgi:hypothetical protein
LCLTARQRTGRPVQRQVVETDVEQEPQPLGDLLEHPLADLALPALRSSSRRNTAASPTGSVHTSAMVLDARHRDRAHDRP